MKAIFLFIFVVFNVNLLNSQNLHIFDVDNSKFPIIEAKVYAIDASCNQISPNKSDLSLTENGKVREIEGIICPSNTENNILSAVLTIDVSGSMSQGTTPNINLAKEFATKWIQDFPVESSKCAITSFDHQNYILQDFTQDRQQLLNSVNMLNAKGGTSYDAALISPSFGALRITQNAENKRVVVMITDGLPDRKPDVAAIIEEANQQNCQIHIITLGIGCPKELKEVSTQTGGLWFEDVRTIEQVSQIYKLLLGVSLASEPCLISWRSERECFINLSNIELQWNNIIAQTNYQPNASHLAGLEFNPGIVYFGGQNPGSQTDVELKIKAINDSFVVNNIRASDPTLGFTIEDVNFPININRNTEQTITVRFIPNDSAFVYTYFVVETDKCDLDFAANGGFRGVGVGFTPTLKITSPKNGETYHVGGEISIEWEGISALDSIDLDFSNNGGEDWLPVASKVSQNKYTWKNIPGPSSSTCKIRARQFGNDADRINVKTIGKHSLSINAVCWTNNGSHIFSGGADAMARRWHGGSYLWVNNYRNFIRNVRGIALNPQNDKIALVGDSFDSALEIWNVNGVLLNLASDISRRIECVDWSKDGTLIAGGAIDFNIRIWNSEDAGQIRLLQGHTGGILSVSFNPQSTTLASGSSDGTVKLWANNTGTLIRTLEPNFPDGVYSVAWSPNGQLLACGGNKSIKIYDTSNWSLIKTISGISDRVYDIDWSPDSKLISASSWQEIRIFNATNYNLHNHFKIEDSWIYSVAWSPDSKRIVSGSEDNSLRIWEIEELTSQTALSDGFFNVAKTIIRARDINMLECYLGELKELVIENFLSNTSSVANRVTSIVFEGADADAFSIVSEAPPFPLPAFSSSNIEFRFVPKRLGPHQAVVKIITLDDTLYTNITGLGIQKSFQIFNSTIDFGQVNLSEFIDLENIDVIRNLAISNMEIIECRIVNPNRVDFDILEGAEGASLLTGEIFKMSLRFFPTKPGMISSLLEINYNSPNSPEYINLIGEAVVFQSNIEVDMQTEKIGLICGDLDSISINIRNTGSELLAVSDIAIIGASANEFYFDLVFPILISESSNQIVKLYYKNETDIVKDIELHFISNSGLNSNLIIPLRVNLEATNFDLPEEISLETICIDESKSFEVALVNRNNFANQFKITVSDGLINFIDEVNVAGGTTSNLVFNTKPQNTVSNTLDTITFVDINCDNEYIVIVGASVGNPIVDVDVPIFESFFGQIVVRDLIIKNNNPFDMQLISIAGLAVPFQVVDNNFPKYIAANQELVLEVMYEPTNTEELTQLWEFIFDKCNYSLMSSISGRIFANTILINTENIAVEIGNQLDLPITLTAETEDRSFSNTVGFELTYNPKVLHYLGDLPSIINENNVVILFGGIDLNYSAKKRQIIVPFATALGNEEITEVSINKVELNIDNAIISTSNGIVNLLGVCYEGGTRFIGFENNIAIKSITPNPALERVALKFELIEHGETIISILDATGKLVKTILRTNLQTTGEQFLDFDISELGSGKYFLTLQTPTFFESKEILITR